MDRGDHGTVERGVKLAPLAGRDHLPCGEPHRLEQHADTDRIGGEHLTEQRHRALGGAPGARRRHRPRFHFVACVTQHRASKHIFRLGMGRDAEARHIDTDDAHAVDRFRQQLQRHAGGARHTKIGDHYGIVLVGVGDRVHRFADVLEQLAGDQGLGVERYIADRAARAIEMRGEGKTVHAAGGTGEDGRGASHPQPDAQRPKGRAHALRLVVRTGGVVLRILRQDLALAGCGSGSAHRVATAMAATVCARDRERRSHGRCAVRGDLLEPSDFGIERAHVRPCRTRPPARACRSAHCRTCPRRSPVAAPRRDRPLRL